MLKLSFKLKAPLVDYLRIKFQKLLKIYFDRAQKVFKIHYFLNLNIKYLTYIAFKYTLF
jgi:hypothetical protein